MQGLTTELVNAVFMATKLAGDINVYVYRVREFAIKCWAEFFVLESCKYLFTVQGFHLFHWYSTERTITSKHVQSDSRQVIFLQRSDQRLN